MKHLFMSTKFVIVLYQISYLEKNWKIIQEEAVNLFETNLKSFKPESETLQDTGDWKQLELFSRGKSYFYYLFSQTIYNYC